MVEGASVCMATAIRQNVIQIDIAIALQRRRVVRGGAIHDLESDAVGNDAVVRAGQIAVALPPGGVDVNVLDMRSVLAVDVIDTCVDQVRFADAFREFWRVLQRLAVVDAEVKLPGLGLVRRALAVHSMLEVRT